MANKLLQLPGNRLFNNSNIASPGGTATLYLSKTSTLANFLDAEGVPLGPTITANGLGQLPDAYGDETVAYRVILRDSHAVELDGGDIDPFYFGRDNSLIVTASGASVNSRALLSQIATPAANQSAILTESGREGTFVFSSANLSSQVTADPDQFNYIAPSTDAAGTSGAWVRKQDSEIRSERGAALVGRTGGGTVQAALTRTDQRTLPSGAENGTNDSNALQALFEATANYAHRIWYGTIALINGRNDTTPVFDAANFAGQTLGSSAPDGFVFHHYTDGIQARFDNVGSGPTLLLKLAQNATRRSDKPANYVGTGRYLVCAKHNDALGVSQDLFFISSAADFTWTGAVNTIATLWNNSALNSGPMFRLKGTNAQTILTDWLTNDIQRGYVENDNDLGSGPTRLVLKSAPSCTNGVGIAAAAGDAWVILTDSTKALRVTSGLVKANSGNLILGSYGSNAAVETQIPLKPRNYNTVADLPSATTYAGCWASLAGIPIYAHAGVWKYFSDNSSV